MERLDLKALHDLFTTQVATLRTGLSKLLEAHAAKAEWIHHVEEYISNAYALAD